MAKSDQLLSNLIDKHIRGKPEFKKPRSTSLYCQACSRGIHVRQASVKFSIESHEKGKRHREQLKVWNTLQREQQFITVGITVEDRLKVELTEFLVKCNIPIYKVSNPYFKKFIAKQCGKLTPDESTLRKNYVNPIYQESLVEMRMAIGSSWIYLQVDESTDSQNRPVVSIVVGSLNGSEPRSFLLDIKHLKSAPDSTLIFRSVNDALRILWPEKIHYKRVRLLVSDQAAYMLKAGRSLKNDLFTEMLHVGCLAHALHGVAELVRKKHPGINSVVSSFKTASIKCPRRRLIMQEATQVAIPNFPILTRWGTWLLFVEFLADHIDDIEVALEQLGEEDSQAIEDLNESLAQPELRDDLKHVKSLTGIAKTITELQQRGLTIDQVKEKIDNLFATLPDTYKIKLKATIAKNPSYLNLFELEGEDRKLYKFAPLVSVDVERTFSHFKLIDTPQRSNLTEEHFKQHAIIKYNSVNNNNAQ